MSYVEDRYKMNSGVLTENDMKKLSNAKVVIIGLGGLGGNVANQLIRLGVKHLTLIDHDTFTETNLNRQLFSNVYNLGRYKVDVIREELKKINPDVTVKTYKQKIQNVLLESYDYLIDCVDNFETRIYLSKLSQKMNSPLLHGSCGGWYGQVGWISPRSNLLEEIYKSGEGLEGELLNPVYAPTVVSSYMTSEFTKMIKNSSTMVIDEILLIDLNNNTLMKTGR